MHRLKEIKPGICMHGPVMLSHATKAEPKHVLSIATYERFKHPHVLCCKTTSKHHDKIYPGEFLISDLFGRGQSKVQPYNICRVPPTDLNRHQYVGILNVADMSQFELGLKIAIKKGLFTPAEILDVVDSWQPIFSL